MQQNFALQLRHTVATRMWALFRVPMIFWVRPWVQHLDEQKVVIKVPLRRRTRNHFHSLYLGTLVTGADLASGLLAQHLVRLEGKGKVSLIFKDLRANFFRRCMSDTYFTCEDGQLMSELVQKTISTQSRCHETVRIVARCPDTDGDKVLAEFFLTLSLKYLGSS